MIIGGHALLGVDAGTFEWDDVTLVDPIGGQSNPRCLESGELLISLELPCEWGAVPIGMPCT